MAEKLFTGTLNHNQNKKNLPDNPDPPPPPPRPRPPLPPPSISPHFFNCTMTGFLDSYLADLDPALSKFHFYINSWSASTRPPPTPSLPPTPSPKKKNFYFKSYTYFNTWVTSPPPFYYLLRVKYLQRSLYILVKI